MSFRAARATYIARSVSRTTTKKSQAMRPKSVISGLGNGEAGERGQGHLQSQSSRPVLSLKIPVAAGTHSGLWRAPELFLDAVHDEDPEGQRATSHSPSQRQVGH